jgi:MFS family permease
VTGLAKAWNVMITDISADLHTDVQGVQVCITLFLLVMAALMIPCGKLTDRFGRKRCFQLGLLVYGVGAVLSAAAPGLGVLILGNSIFEGVGTALLIPPVYILTTMLFGDMKSRARAFGAISGMGGIGAATGPLIGGAITAAISWRAVAATHLFASNLSLHEINISTSAERVAAVVFGLNMTLAALMVYLMLRHAERTPGLAADDRRRVANGTGWWA